VNARYSYGKIKADDVGTLTSTILITFQFDVTGLPTDRESFVGHNRGSQIEKIQLNQTIICRDPDSPAAQLEILSELCTFRYKLEIWHTDSSHQYKHFQI